MKLKTLDDLRAFDDERTELLNGRTIPGFDYAQPTDCRLKVVQPVA